ncbi:dienelactone hydrolase family protein [Kiloniella sp. EL199]|uniref:dienelactone hydrolase family protein n=1 Tax=Kiloniella sp. EL199 TaxID=2107581 RepID=UPI0013C42A9C|nr:dienelactone hydrolase family protein [Kiloniella sp. EL199]
MKFEHIIVRATVLLFIVTATNSAKAQEKITFPSAPIMPSPFKQKQAKAKGITLTPIPAPDLQGYLFRPKTSDKSPAIITLLSGDGLQKSHFEWGQELASWGYINLLVDSFGSRGGTNWQDTPNANIQTDAYNAYQYLTKQQYVNPKKIGVMGFSLGASRIFSILNETNIVRPNDVSFQAGVALYPNCDSSIKLNAPLFILIGDEDPLAPYRSCKTIVTQAKEWKNSIKYVLYPSVTHFYDNKNYSKVEGNRDKTQPLPYQFEKNHYDAKAHQDSLRQIKSFFDQHLN